MKSPTQDMLERWASDDDLNRMTLPAGWRRLSLAPGERRLRESTTGRQLLGVVEENATQQYGVGLWSRDGRLQQFWNGAFGATWVTENRLLLATWRQGLSYELIDSDGDETLGHLRVDGPKSIAGMVLSTAADGRHCGAEMYSGESEAGFSVLRLGDPMQRIINFEYVSGETDLSGVAFSHDGRRAAWAVMPWAVWWCPGDRDAEDDTPSPGGVVEWASLYVADLETCAVGRAALATSLPEGWTPDEGCSNAGPPAALAFTPGGRIRMGVPWFGNVELDAGTSEQLLVPGPAR